MATIPIECPKCGRWGSVPPNRLYVKINCRNCQAPFYVNSDYDAMPGEPPPDKGAAATKTKGSKDKKKSGAAAATATATKPKKAKSAGSGPEFDLVERWKEMTDEEKNRVKLTSALVAIVLVGVTLYFRAPASDPIKEKAIYVARAFADNDWSRIQTMCMMRTDEDAKKWLDGMRKKAGMTGSSSDYKISADYANGAARDSSVQFMATLSPLHAVGTAPDPRTSRSAGAQLVLLPITLGRDDSGQWRFNGSATLQSSGLNMGQ